VGKATFIIDAEGRRVPISGSTARLRDERGAVVGGAETFRDLSVVEQLRPEITGRWQLGDSCSRSASLRRVREVLPRIAASEATILVPGETGTGKGLVARAIHGLSARRDGPFVAVNRGALPDTRLAAARELGVHESTLFRKVQQLGIDLPARDGRSRRDPAPAE
jgi:transcriptional regulator with PAS, ATPase and Fis domain